MSVVKIAEEYGYFGTPIYTTTLERVLGNLLDSDIVQYDAFLNHWADQFPEELGVPVESGSNEEIVLSDAFFNCEFICELGEESKGRVEAAAKAFNQALPEPFRTRYTTQWLADEFWERL